MKVVCCKNCGAKYQLNDDDDISTFECSSCAGDLEYLEDYSNEENESNDSAISQTRYNNSYIVQCQDCGLKYKIKTTDSILDYECDSCGGSLRYLDENLNKELDSYIEERKVEIQNIRKETIPNEPTSEEFTTDYDNTSIKTFTDRLENFFSEEHMRKIADAEKEEEQKEPVMKKTARTTIPQSVLSKFGREFDIPQTNDYDTLKNFLKEEFFKGIEEDYYSANIVESKPKKSFLDKISLSEPEIGGITDTPVPDIEEELKFEIEPSKIPNFDGNKVPVIIGAVIFILSIIEILTINGGIGIAALFIGVIILCYGLYRNKDIKETEERTRIIREHLLSLPEEFYVFYNVRTPTSSSGINHVVVGPTGIYALLSQKYNPKLRLESENENLNLIGSTTSDEERFEDIGSYGKQRFKYTTKQAKFPQDNKVKQKSLSLGEDLINFLNDNNIKNCFVEPLVGFINHEVVVINMPLTDEDLFIEELLHKIQNSTVKLDSETINKCAVLINKYSADCSSEF